MLFRKNIDYEKISFNSPKELVDKIDEISDFYFCNRTDVINEAINYYYKSFKKRVKRIEKRESTKTP